MYLPVPTPLAFLFIVIAAFAPVASHWPGWWMAYYASLLVCWVVIAVVAMRRMAHDELRTKRRLAKMLRKRRHAPIRLVETDADADVGHDRTVPPSEVPFTKP